MRHAFHRPLRPAFHFYLYLPRRPSASHPHRHPPPYPDVPGSPGTWWKKSVAPTAVTMRRSLSPSPSFSRYFTTFCFQSAGRRRRGITGHLGPYSTFMALNRDEVSRERTNVLDLGSPFSSSPPSLLSFLASHDIVTSRDRRRSVPEDSATKFEGRGARILALLARSRAVISIYSISNPILFAERERRSSK